MLLGIIILSVTLSIDALFAGFSYGLNGTRIPLTSKLIICAFSVIYCAAALLLGSAFAGLLPPIAGKITGAAILAALGVFMIVKSRIKPDSKRKDSDESPKTLCKIIIKSLGITIQILKNNPAAGDVDASGVIDKKEAVLLGFALSVDSLGAGIGCAMSGLSAWYIPPAVGICQLAFLSAGLLTGKFLCEKCSVLSKKYDAVTSVLPGILLIVLSILRFF
ncbi:MAG TPA: sporulation membrane protein YtaF [Ruminiclostridium sp.]|nr:sporulation membrane protein YtaF [Ruminiclostridium sp.]